MKRIKRLNLVEIRRINVEYLAATLSWVALFAGAVIGFGEFNKIARD